jgi:hypothetical protein
MSLCETLYGRRPWPELELHGPAMGSSPEMGKRGKEEGSRGGTAGSAAWVEGGLQEGRHGGSGLQPLFGLLLGLLLYMRRKEEGEEKKRKEKEGKEKRKKEKKYGKFSKLEK